MTKLQLGAMAFATALLINTQPPKGDHLYIMHSIEYDIYKIGRSKDPYRRNREIRARVKGEVELIKIYPYKGYIEGNVHNLMEIKNVDTKHGTEWFHLDSKDFCKIDSFLFN